MQRAFRGRGAVARARRGMAKLINLEEGPTPTATATAALRYLILRCRQHQHQRSTHPPRFLTHKILYHDLKMYCQKCRQPIRADATIAALNPATFDVLVGQNIRCSRSLPHN